MAYLQTFKFRKSTSSPKHYKLNCNYGFCAILRCLFKHFQKAPKSQYGVKNSVW